MENHPIPVSEANAMIDGYLQFLTQHGIDPASQTQSISFTGTGLMGWLNKTMASADELRICLGVYPAGHAQAGRLTVILWPYKNGKPTNRSIALDGKDDPPPPPPPPTDPYNAGSLNP